MTNPTNEQSESLRSASESRWVVRQHGKILSHHKTSRDAVRWLGSQYPGVEMKDLIEQGVKVTQSFTVTARYWDRRYNPPRTFPAEFTAEAESFADAMDILGTWLHRSWEQDRDNHPSPVGRQQAWERWHDVLALSHIASLTMIKNPTFRYAFGPLSPPEGKGHDLRLLVVPTSEFILEGMVRDLV